MIKALLLLCRFRLSTIEREVLVATKVHFKNVMSPEKAESERTLLIFLLFNLFMLESQWIFNYPLPNI